MNQLWKLHGNGRTVRPGEVVLPDERLRLANMLGLGAQHVLAMFGSTALVPVLTGFPVATTIFFSGVGTLLFNLVTVASFAPHTIPPVITGSADVHRTALLKGAALAIVEAPLIGIAGCERSCVNISRGVFAVYGRQPVSRK